MPAGSVASVADDPDAVIHVARAAHATPAVLDHISHAQISV
ncbi:hypothetical protein [Burkholderia contaminans]|nr:hypothetical protein [Burkholderia contaminans]